MHSVLAVILAALYLILNLATAERSPTVSMDEVWFVEPAVNLARGRGFTTAAWDVQDRHQFWAGNAPLYSLLLSGWMRVVDLTPRGVRSLNYVLALLAAVCCVVAATRHGFLPRPRERLLLFAALLCTHSISFSYRSGRYDTTAMLVFSLAFLATSVRRAWLRYTLLACCGVFVLPAGFQLSVYTAVLSVLLILFLGRRVLPDLVAFGAGVAAGLLVLYAVYASHGVWDDFLSTLSRHSVVPVAEAQSTGFNDLAGKWRQLPGAALVDKVNLILIAVLLVVARRSRGAMFAVSLAVALPLIIQLLYTYRIYYGWMTVIPLLIAVVASGHRLAYAAAVLAMVFGLPARIALSAVEWDARDYEPVRQLVTRNLRPEDWAYVDFQAYYPAKRLAGEVFLPPYLRAFTPAEKQRVSVLVLGSESDKYRFSFPGTWRQVDALSRPETTFAAPYELAVYRRVR